MLKLDENVQNLSLIEELSNAKTQTLPHSVSTKADNKTLYKVYVESNLGNTVGKAVETTSSESPEKKKAILLTSEEETDPEFWSEFFTEKEANCDECNVDNNVIVVNVKKQPQKLNTNPETLDIVQGDSLQVLKSDLSGLDDGSYVLCSVDAKTNGSDITFSTFNGNESDVQDSDIKVKITKDGSNISMDPVEGYPDVTSSTTISLENSDLLITCTASSVELSPAGSSVVLKKLIETVYETKTIAKLDFGQDGYNKTHTQKNATVTKNSNYINGLKIAIYYVVDEIRYLTLGTLNPTTAKISINESLIVNDNVVNDEENEALLNKIKELNNINNVECTTVNKSEETPSPISTWDPNISEIQELHPVDENGNPLENLVEGSIRLQIGEIPDEYLSGDEQAEGCVILADRPVKQIVDDDDFTRFVLDDSSVTSNGVLNRFKSAEIIVNGETKIFFEKEAYSVGTVYYNTGVIELNNPVPVVAGIAPSLICTVSGMKNLKVNILDKGSDGNKYSIKIIKDHTELNGDVIYKLSLVLNNNEVDSITCSSNSDGSVIEGSDANGNPIDVTVPYIGNIEHDIFNTVYLGVEDDLKSLHDGTYSCVNGTDGVDGITAKDYIGYKDESGTTGAWLFDDVRYRAQMWPSLGYTDKEFYMAAQDIAWNRKDTTCVWDVPKGYSKKTAIAFREEAPTPDKWWTELYYNWCNDVFNLNVVELPPSFYVTKNSLASYKVNGTWFPVAGKERGTIDAASVINQVPAKLDRDDFITHNINPIYDTGNQGIQIYGNDTLNGQYTDLSAAHIARTLTYIRSRIDTYTETLKFELNDVMLWRTWTDYVTSKILEPIKSARGLQWYRATMGSQTTTVEELANRIVRGVIECQFVQSAEIFKLDYVVYSSAADNSTF